MDTYACKHILKRKGYFEMNDDDRTLTRADKQDILDHITQERRNAENYIDDTLVEMDSKLDAIQKDVDTIASVFGFARDKETKQLKRR